ncbi:MAG: sulfatase [Acidobacteria bacterium]|nr:sulfatase [Acidobacteriota bacterium]
MNRRTFLQTATVAGGALAAQAQQSTLPPAGTHIPQPQRDEHPNVIWMFGDQFRAQALPFNGDPNARTPWLERAEVNGVNFTNHVSGFPLCCPFRGTLLTSRYPHHCVPGHEYPLPAGQKTIADVFNSNGYDTAYFGKWHLGGFHESQGRAAFFITDPNRRGGFKKWVGYENNNSQWDCWVHGGAGKDAFHYRLNGYETDQLTNLLLDYLKERAEERKNGRVKPFFASLSVQPPHDPYIAPAEFMEKYNPERLELRLNVAHSKTIREQARRELAGYYAMIENLDWNYGRVIHALQESGLADNTHVMFFADHGDSHGSHGMFRKTNPYNESIHTPLLFTGGQTRYMGRNGRFPVLSNTADIAPTTLGLCGIAKPEWMEGTDLSGYRLARGGSPPAPDSVYLQNVIPTGHPDSINTPYRGIVTRDGWKYVCFENHSWLLFNLEDDPYEEANLAQNNKYRAQRRKAIARLKQWVADTGDKFAIPED